IAACEESRSALAESRARRASESSSVARSCPSETRVPSSNMTLVTRPVIFAAIVARRRGVMYPLAFKTPAGPFTGLRTVATSTSALRSRKAEAATASKISASAPRISQSQRLLDPVALRLVSLMRREPRSGFSDLGVVAMRRHLLGMGVALNSEYAPGNPYISARGSRNCFASILPAGGQFWERNEEARVRAGRRDRKTGQDRW